MACILLWSLLFIKNKRAENLKFVCMYIRIYLCILSTNERCEDSCIMHTKINASREWQMFPLKSELKTIPSLNSGTSLNFSYASNAWTESSAESNKWKNSQDIEGSKISGKVCSTIYSNEFVLNLSLRWTHNCNFFHAELRPIIEAGHMWSITANPYSHIISFPRSLLIAEEH